MLILCRVGEVETVVVGYGPGKTSPMAIVPWLDKDGEYILRAIPLSQCKIDNLPAKLRKKLRTLNDKRHAKALENTKKLAELTISDANSLVGESHS